MLPKELPEAIHALFVDAYAHGAGVPKMKHIGSLLRSQGMRFSNTSFRQAYHHVKDNFSPHLPDPPQPPPTNPDFAYERQADRIYEFLGRTRARFTAGFTAHRNERYCLMSDLHLPFCDEEILLSAICEAIEQYHCNTLLLGGDTFDFYTISRYAKKKELTFREELGKGKAILDFLAQAFPRVKLILGNHDGGRWERLVGEEVSHQIRWLVQSPWEMLLGDLPNVERIGIELPFGGELQWLAIVGKDACFTHWQKSSAQQGVNLDSLDRWLDRWSGVLGLPRALRFIATGHTHRGTMLQEHDKLLIETGTMANWDIQRYAMGPDGTSRKPGVKGWTLLVQTDGVTDLKESRFIRSEG